MILDGIISNRDQALRSPFNSAGALVYANTVKMDGMNDRIKIGVGSCMLGEKVRYDGCHKLDSHMTDTLGMFA